MRGASPPADLGRVLFVSAFVIATCGLVYELVAGALASYLLGDSITQFSLVIGVYLSAMGVGSYLSRFVDRGLLARFVEIELAVAIIGGFSAPLLYAAFTWTGLFRPLLFGLVFTTGTLVGLELPLLIRLLESRSSLKELVARVLFLDYIGALAASLAFPLLLVPKLGLMRTSLVFGLLNAFVALWATSQFERGVVAWRLRGLCALTLALLIAGLTGAGRAEAVMEAALFADPLVLHTRSPYQRVTVTADDGDVRLYLNGALQFSSVDEYRYHEALVHPAMASVPAARHVLVMGGGDGLAVREVLRWPEVEAVTLVDLDPEVTRLFTERDELSALNSEALKDPRVTVVNADAFTWLLEGGDGQRYDVGLIDFPDPNDFGLGKLYTNHFYRLLSRQLTDEAVFAVQSTSPLFSPEAYWCIVRTLESEVGAVRPYHAYVPAFGEWGFVLARASDSGALTGFRDLPSGMRFLSPATLTGLFHFPPDMDRLEGPVNRLDNQALVRLYEADWREIRGP